jgi:hypothetical protein
LVNCILEAVQEDLLTSSLAAKEVSARIDVHKQYSLLLIVGVRVSIRTIQNCFSHCCFKHSDLEMLNKASGENDVTLEMHYMGYYDEFSRIDISLQRYSENEVCEKAVVKQIAEQNIRIRQKIRKPMITRSSMNESD